MSIILSIWVRGTNMLCTGYSDTKRWCKICYRCVNFDARWVTRLGKKTAENMIQKTEAIDNTQNETDVNTIQDISTNDQCSDIAR